MNDGFLSKLWEEVKQQETSIFYIEDFFRLRAGWIVLVWVDERTRSFAPSDSYLLWMKNNGYIYRFVTTTSSHNSIMFCFTVFESYLLQLRLERVSLIDHTFKDGVKTACRKMEFRLLILHFAIDINIHESSKCRICQTLRKSFLQNQLRTQKELLGMYQW